MKFPQRLLLLAGALLACHFCVGVAKTVAAPANNDPAGSADATTVSHGIPAENTMLIHSSSSGISVDTSVTKTITIFMPAETLPETTEFVLNGKDAARKFSETSCSEGVCETGTLSKSAALTMNLQ